MKKLALAAIVLVALAFPAIALAKKIRVTGGVNGDTNSQISANVTKKGDDIRKISNFKAAGIDLRCDGQTVDGFQFTILGSIPVNDKRSFKARLQNDEDASELLRVSGKVAASGARVKGNMKTNKLTVEGQTCDMPKQRYVLKK